MCGLKQSGRLPVSLHHITQWEQKSSDWQEAVLQLHCFPHTLPDSKTFLDCEENRTEMKHLFYISVMYKRVVEAPIKHGQSLK